jgi:hypothetical protein
MAKQSVGGQFETLVGSTKREMEEEEIDEEYEASSTIHDRGGFGAVSG